MAKEHIGHSENMLLQRGIFSMTDFDAFQKSDVFLLCIVFRTRRLSIYDSLCSFV